jgi:predicted methyltransferase
MSTVEAVFQTLKACRADKSFDRRDDLDQCPATIETTMRRLALLMRLSLLEKRCVLLLGDDDLLSLAISVAGLCTRVTVIDLDYGVLSRIARWTRNAAIELIHHDLRLGLPANVAHDYDVVFTDPPYTAAGQFLFLRAGMSALSNLESSSLFLCSSRFYLGQAQISRIISAAEQAGLRLCGVEEDFNEYEAPPDVAKDLLKRKQGGKGSYLYSSLFHFKPVDPILKPESLPFLPSQIYDY